MNRFGAFIWNFPRLFALFWCAATTLGCAPHKFNVQMFEESVRQADVLTAIRSEFERTHKLEGVVVQVAMERLEEEGFKCSLEYKKLPVIKKGTIDQFGLETIPMIYCSRPHIKSGVDDTCKIFWAAFEVDWRDSSLPPEILRNEFDVSPIRNERYFCRFTVDRY